MDGKYQTNNRKEAAKFVFLTSMLCFAISKGVLFPQGYVVVKDLFNHEELQHAIDGVNELVDSMANKLFAAGKIKGK